MRRAPALTFSSPAYVVALSSLSSTSSAVGPTIIVPSTVGETRMPLPIFDGHWNIVAENVPSSSRSSIRYSPRRALIEYFLPHTRLLISSEWQPAQFTTARTLNSRPSASATRYCVKTAAAYCPSSSSWDLLIETTFASKRKSAPLAAAFSA